MSLEFVDTIASLRRALAAERRKSHSIGFVPTMGALHEGHGALIRRAAAENDCVVLSIFVNPIQFNDPEDYRLYPRNLQEDSQLAAEWGARILFAPSVEQMYPEPPATTVDVAGLTEKLCGEFRPGHFRGVATVVAKLLNLVQPDRAYFGQKDAQQLAVVRRMVRDLNFPVEIVAVPTVREPDGLALSSRNLRLGPEERRLAPRIYQALLASARLAEQGVRCPEKVRREGLALLEEPAFRVEYFEVVDPESMQPVAEITGEVLIAAAVRLGDVRLIDNVLCQP